jgi:hypothetical protein
VFKCRVVRVDDVAGIGILGHEFECGLFASPANEQGNVWLLDTLGLVNGAANLVIVPSNTACSCVHRARITCTASRN